jgi:hypothetical protein
MVQGQHEGDPASRLLVFNCHEAWVYQLGALGRGLDVIVGLRGRHTQTWDERMRPLPANARLVRLAEALGANRPYYCIVAHNISDLLDVKTLPGPRLLVLHSTLAGRAVEEGSKLPPERMREVVRRYLELVGGHAVSISAMKAQSWHLDGDVVPNGVSPDDYPPYCGDVAEGLRICNHINRRRKILLWDFHEKAFGGIPMHLVGLNPDMPGVEPARSWDDLKQLLRSRRFYAHTADARYEDGYNLAMLEAMAAGMPVLGNDHPTSPISHGVSGFLSGDPEQLRACARRLIEDRGLARKMGEEARRTVAERFHASRFKEGFSRSIETARRTWRNRQAAGGAPTPAD